MTNPHPRPSKPSLASTAPSPVRLSPALLQRRLRDIHLYLGMLFAPSLLFFALTGAVQLYGLHEVRPNRGFEPPALLQELGMVHKDQVFRMPRRHAPNPPPQMASPATADAPPEPAAPPAAPPPEHQAEWKIQVLKAFFLLAALGLTVSTCLGVWLGLKSGRNRRLAFGLLVAGVLLPVFLLVA